MNRIDRLMGIITLLQSQKNRTSAQIAAHFGISERTVYRDLKAIGEIGVPVFFDPNKGYSVNKGFFLPPVSLTIEEAHALSLAEPLVLRFTDKSIQHHFNSALLKIKMVLGQAQQKNMEKAQANTAHFIPDKYAHMLPDKEHLTQLQNAISNQQVVDIQYLNAEQIASRRHVEPIGLTFYSLNWHLIAWCQLRNEYRDFRVSRIEKMKVTLQAFQKTDHLSLHEYLQTIQEDLFQHPDHPLT